MEEEEASAGETSCSVIDPEKGSGGLGAVRPGDTALQGGRSAGPGGGRTGPPSATAQTHNTQVSPLFTEGGGREGGGRGLFSGWQGPGQQPAGEDT